MPTNKNVIKTLFDDEEQKAINRAAKRHDLTAPNLLRVAVGKFIGNQNLAPHPRRTKGQQKRQKVGHGKNHTLNLTPPPQPLPEMSRAQGHHASDPPAGAADAG
jgi:transposase-like protein